MAGHFLSGLFRDQYHWGLQGIAVRVTDSDSCLELHPLENSNNDIKESVV